jgi:hypothetical protein
MPKSNHKSKSKHKSKHKSSHKSPHKHKSTCKENDCCLSAVNSANNFVSKINDLYEQFTQIVTTIESVQSNQLLTTSDKSGIIMTLTVEFADTNNAIEAFQNAYVTQLSNVCVCSSVNPSTCCLPINKSADLYKTYIATGFTRLNFIVQSVISVQNNNMILPATKTILWGTYVACYQILVGNLGVAITKYTTLLSNVCSCAPTTPSPPSCDCKSPVKKSTEKNPCCFSVNSAIKSLSKLMTNLQTQYAYLENLSTTIHTSVTDMMTQDGLVQQNITCVQNISQKIGVANAVYLALINKTC